MQIQRKSQPSFTNDVCLIVAAFSDKSLSPLGVTLNTQSEGALQKILDQNDLSHDLGACLFLPILPHIESKVLLVYCGNPHSLDGRNYQKILAHVSAQLPSLKTTEIYCELTQLFVLNKEESWKVFQAAHILGSKFYKFNTLKSEKKAFHSIESLSFETSLDKPLKQADALIHGLNLIKDLANLPANICTPTYLAEEAKKLSNKFTSIKTEILEESDMAKLGMNTLLSVSKGSKQPAKLICFHYQGGSKDQKPITFVGKGITFDTGGISLKPSAAMDEMKYDMCGGATVFGLMQTAAELNLPLNIIGLVPAVENMPGGEATRPGDIVKSLSGKTIEILNTDAEGRLILCDTLTYAEKFSPEVVIDMATLTGAAVMTFGSVANVLMGNNQPLINDLLKISEECGERSWQLPLWDEYQEMLKSNFADLPNIHHDNNAKTIIAGCFLSRFTQNYPWAHIDIAGTAWNSGKEKGATGRPLMLLLSYLLSKTS
jgi:leucyl aminopeptidase